MVRTLIADYRAKNIYAIPAERYQELGFTLLFVDLDNTLAPYDEKVPSSLTYKYVARLLRAGIEVVLVSNNTKKRVGEFARRLGVNYLSSAHKPFKGRLLRYLHDHDLEKSRCLYIGDQVINDAMYAHKAGLKCVLTEPLVKKDHISTRMIRWLDRKLRKKYLQQSRLGRLINGEEEK